ncbi:hypothetical protein BDQ17DRAFT_1328317 [Cyathus striatus]|nr:hypothetical protein BDQ17DRAFT_1328317 [Cyathus striatus]
MAVATSRSMLRSRRSLNTFIATFRPSLKTNLNRDILGLDATIGLKGDSGADESIFLPGMPGYAALKLWQLNAKTELRPSTRCWKSPCSTIQLNRFGFHSMPEHNNVNHEPSDPRSLSSLLRPLYGRDTRKHSDNEAWESGRRFTWLITGIQHSMKIEWNKWVSRERRRDFFSECTFSTGAIQTFDSEAASSGTSVYEGVMGDEQIIMDEKPFPC